MNKSNSNKALILPLIVMLTLSLLYSGYILFNTDQDAAAKAGAIETAGIGTDPMLDCQLCEAVVNTVYKYLPQGASFHEVDSVAAMVFGNVPVDWHYITEDIRGYHYYEFESYIEHRFDALYISTRLGYCREGY